MNPFALVVLLLLLLVAGRRTLFVVAALLPSRSSRPASEDLPSLCVLASIRNGGDDTNELLNAIERLHYPRQRLSFILIDDGSRDGTGESLDRWVSTHERCSFVEHKESIGKAAALQDALALMSPVAEVIAVLDADTRPEPSYLLELVAPFADPRCGAVTGQARPLIEPHSAIGLYAALEIWVYQGITLAAKDRLGLNPPTVGGICAYRRSALEEAGGFPGDAQAEDIAISLTMNSRGWETRFQPMAISRLRTVSHWRHFMHQRRRWSTSLLASAPLAAGPESLAVVLGYADRPLLVAAVFLIAVGFLPVSTLALYVLPAGLTLLAALFKARIPFQVMGRLLFWLGPMYLLDLCVSLGAALAALRRRPLAWLSRAEAESSTG